MTLLDEALSEVKDGMLSGEVAFKLYDTYGFPLDLTADVCRERNITIDEAAFEREMAAQRTRAQAASQFGIDYNNVIRVEGETKFEGYTESESIAKITALFYEGKSVEQISAGQSAVVVLENTPFYAESGGQIGDSGYLTMEDVTFNVKDTQKYGQIFGHIGELEQGTLSVGQIVNAVVDVERRHQTSLNHSATHLLHAALRQLLGTHVVQKGSLVSEKALRFDFSHPEAITKEQLADIERLVNQKIRANFPIQTEIMEIETAKAKGAMALFGEKYADQVRVLSMGDFSIELCGGIHAKRTGDIGLFKITVETAVAAGIRRIEAVTGENAVNWILKQQRILNQSAELLKSDVNALVDKIQQYQDKTKN
ncbi:alanyl-tRNA synthase [Rodentibacter pneumotropicus]|uniref:Alanine--tRNA ligase n=1 Tax=Rodentibacter pneumotropicus TaxID=758 RepID=A0A3S4UA23_9PAST|nr:alanyl-tRNA synthase [Rodentibacter pneumotropicus]